MTNDTIPTKPGWYKARWLNLGRTKPRQGAFDTDIRETSRGVVYVTRWGSSELAVCMLDGSVRRLDEFEWGPSIDDLERDCAVLREVLDVARGFVESEARHRIDEEQNNAALRVLQYIDECPALRAKSDGET